MAEANGVAVYAGPGIKSSIAVKPAEGGTIQLALSLVDGQKVWEFRIVPHQAAALIRMLATCLERGSIAR